MENIIHCDHCQEDMNQADWEANSQHCLQCGKLIGNFSMTLSQPRRFEPIKARLQFADIFRQGRSLQPTAETRLYA